MGKKSKKSKSKKSAHASSHPRPVESFDASLALARPLTPTQQKHLSKIGDEDRKFIREQVLLQFKQDEARLGIASLTAADLELALDHRDQVAKVLADVDRFRARLAAAQEITDDSIWHDLLKIHDYVGLKGKEDAGLGAGWAFLDEFLKKRSGHRAHAPASSGQSSPAAPAAK